LFINFVNYIDLELTEKNTAAALGGPSREKRDRYLIETCDTVGHVCSGRIKSKASACLQRASRQIVDSCVSLSELYIK